MEHWKRQERSQSDINPGRFTETETMPETKEKWSRRRETDGESRNGRSEKRDKEMKEEKRQGDKGTREER